MEGRCLECDHRIHHEFEYRINEDTPSFPREKSSTKRSSYNLFSLHYPRFCFSNLSPTLRKKFPRRFLYNRNLRRFKRIFFLLNFIKIYPFSWILWGETCWIVWNFRNSPTYLHEKPLSHKSLYTLTSHHLRYFILKISLEIIYFSGSYEASKSVYMWGFFIICSYSNFVCVYVCNLMHRNRHVIGKYHKRKVHVNYETKEKHFEVNRTTDSWGGRIFRGFFINSPNGA